MEESAGYTERIGVSIAWEADYPAASVCPSFDRNVAVRSYGL